MRVPRVAGVRTSSTLGRYSSAIRAACANERSCGSARGAISNGRPYRDLIWPCAGHLSVIACFRQQSKTRLLPSLGFPFVAWLSRTGLAELEIHLDLSLDVYWLAHQQVGPGSAIFAPHRWPQELIPARVTAVQLEGRGGQSTLCIRHVGTQAECFAPLRLGAGFIMLLVEGTSQVVVGYSVVRIIAERALQRVDGAAGIFLADLHLSLVDEGIHVVSVGLEDLVVDYGSFVEAVFADQKLNIVLPDRNVIGMIAVERSVLIGSLIEIAGGEIEVAEQAVAFLMGEIFLGLSHDGFGLRLLAFLHQHANERGAGLRTLRIHVDGVFELVFRFGQTVSQLIEEAELEKSCFQILSGVEQAWI